MTNGYSSLPLTWFTLRHQQLCPPLLLCHLCKCQYNEKGKQHLHIIMKITLTLCTWWNALRIPGLWGLHFEAQCCRTKDIYISTCVNWLIPEGSRRASGICKIRLVTQVNEGLGKGREVRQRQLRNDRLLIFGILVVAKRQAGGTIGSSFGWNSKDHREGR